MVDCVVDLGGFVADQIERIERVHRPSTFLGGQVGCGRPMREGQLKIEGREDESFCEGDERSLAVEFLGGGAAAGDPDSASLGRLDGNKGQGGLTLGVLDLAAEELV